MTKLLQVTEKAAEQYRTTVRGNKYLAYDQIQKKLSRNIQLVKEADRKYTKKNLLSTTYMYGNLYITTRFNKVVDVTNHKGKPTDWHVNWKRYEQLSKELGILDYKHRNHYSKRKRKLS